MTTSTDSSRTCRTNAPSTSARASMVELPWKVRPMCQSEVCRIRIFTPYGPPRTFPQRRAVACDRHPDEFELEGPLTHPHLDDRHAVVQHAPCAFTCAACGAARCE